MTINFFIENPVFISYPRLFYSEYFPANCPVQLGFCHLIIVERLDIKSLCIYCFDIRIKKFRIIYYTMTKLNSPSRKAISMQWTLTSRGSLTKNKKTRETPKADARLFLCLVLQRGSQAAVCMSNSDIFAVQLFPGNKITAGGSQTGISSINHIQFTGFFSR